MSLPFYIVTLTHPSFEDALASVRRLPEEAIPELRLDLYPDLEPQAMIDALKRRCVVTCRRANEGGRWEGDEEGRIARLIQAAEARPYAMDLEWELSIPDAIQAHRTHMRVIRSVHVAPGVFDLDERLAHLPDGDAYKWVGHAARLSDNAKVKPALAWAKDHGIALSAFLMGPKGVASRCLQAVWGGAFTYAASDDAPAAAPGQFPVSSLKAWRCHKLRSSYGVCGVFGSPVLHSKGPGFHNPRFQAAFKDLVYLPLESGDAEETVEAFAALGVLGASLTAPLKETVPPLLGLKGPLNTLWRASMDSPWQCANTDLEAIGQALSDADEGPVLLMGHGGVAHTTIQALEASGRRWMQVSLDDPRTVEDIAALAPVGVIQATSLGMKPGDPRPFAELLDAASPSLKWAVEWIYKEDTAFAQWARGLGLPVTDGGALFELQAIAQSQRFIAECGG
ncbi:MAG TPA: type I 3-dehydroquinate dehydratase [Holophaga sp.]|nr:type I 3-dehydroquinate dehydratase [Holophaga sp.]